jgi:hypothetical protein
MSDVVFREEDEETFDELNVGDPGLVQNLWQEVHTKISELFVLQEQFNKQFQQLEDARLKTFDVRLDSDGVLSQIRAA